MGANSQLPKDISIQWIKQMDEEFHARFKATACTLLAMLYITPTSPCTFT